MGTNEDYDFWVRAAVAGFRFARNEMPLGDYRRRDDSLSADDMRMLRGIIRVYTKHRPALLYYRPALDILDLQIKRFEAELIAAQARHAMDTKDFTSAKERIAELTDRRGGAKLGLVKMMSRWTPGLLWKAYQVRRNRQQTPAGLAGTMKYSVVIATHNRAADLRDTLASLAALQPDGPWEVIVVDNNSPDHTRQVVEAAAPTFPVALRYLFEARQGRSPALNAGISAARGQIIATTDDDVRVPRIG